MLIDKPGWIADRILLLGSRHAISYIIKGDHLVLYGGNLAWEVPRLEAQLNQFGINPELISYLVVSHTHHDHCGAVPYFVKRYPRIKTVASQYAAYVLGRDKAVDVLRFLNRQTFDALGRPRTYEGVDLGFDAIPIDLEVGTGDQLDLGGGAYTAVFQHPGAQQVFPFGVCSPGGHAVPGGCRPGAGFRRARSYRYG